MMDETRAPHPADDTLPADLLALARRVAAMPVPRPTAEQTRRLVEHALAAEVAARVAVAVPRPPARAVLGIARWRVRLLGGWFWVACAALLAFAIALSLAGALPGVAAPLVLLLPLTGVMGLAQALRTPSPGLRAIERAVPVSFVAVTAGVALAIVAVDCAFGLVATAILALVAWAPFTNLLLAWLGPLLLLTALALVAGVRQGAGVALALGAAPWLALALVALLWPEGLASAFFAVPRAPLALALHALAAALGAALLLLGLRAPTGRRALGQLT